MKMRFWLWQRNGTFYLQDAETRQKESLHTRDRHEAERIRNARNDAATRPVLGMALAKAYLTAHDADIFPCSTRTAAESPRRMPPPCSPSTDDSPFNWLSSVRNVRR